MGWRPSELHRKLQRKAVLEPCLLFLGTVGQTPALGCPGWKGRVVFAVLGWNKLLHSDLGFGAGD